MNEIMDVLRHYGHWAHGGNIDEVAREWSNLSFTADDVRRWLESGTFDPDAAAKLRSVGVTPDDVSIQTIVHESFVTLGYAFSNGDVGLDDVLETVAAEGDPWY